MREGLRSGSKFCDTIEEDEGLERKMTAKASTQEGTGGKFVDRTNGGQCKLKDSGEEGEDLSSDGNLTLERTFEDEECSQQSGTGKDAIAKRKRGRVVGELKGDGHLDKRKKVKQEDSDCQGIVLLSSSLGETEGEKQFVEDGKLVVLGIGVNGVGGSGTRAVEANEKLQHGILDVKSLETTNEDEDLGGIAKAKLNEEFAGTESGSAIGQRKRVNEKDLDGHLLVSRRVLRSNTMARTMCENDVGEELDDVSGVEIRANECNGSVKITSKAKLELLDVESCFGPPINNENPIKRKRGRPPKVLLEGETDTPWKHGRPSRVLPERETDVLHKRGREPKVLLEGETDTPRRRGRPPKVSGPHSVEKIRMKHEKRVEADEPRKRGRPRKLLLTDDSSNNVVAKQVKTGKANASRKVGRPPKGWRGDVSEMIEAKQGRKGKASKQRRGRPRKDKLTKTDEGAAFLQGDDKSDGEKSSTHKEVKYTDEELEQQKAEPKAGERGARKLEKQLVRDKILEMLLGAGWTVEYRPREGRRYNDAVYVNPEGRTHWSVTLAYRVLKQHYDNGGSDSATCKPGFKFTPLSDEDIEILCRVVSKERCDKNKRKKDWRLEKQSWKKAGVNSKEKWKKKLNKRRLGSQANPSGKTLKGRKKPKFASSGQGYLVVASDQTRGKKHHKTHNTKRYALMVRNTLDLSGSNKGDGYVLYDGKRTVLSWMIELGGVLRFAKVEYSKAPETKTPFTGSITTDGIRCDCCGGTFTVPQFGNHAGGNYCDSYHNTCIEDGRSLLECQLDTWLKQDECFRSGFHLVDTSGDDPNDDTCGICGDGGDLVCCDGCPSTFHQSCLGVEKFPSGIWHCIYCSCKFCGNACQGIEDDPTAAGPLRECCLCEEKYHVSCVQSKDAQDGDSILSFCGKNCHELNERLQLLLGVKHELHDGFSWTLVRRLDIGSDISLKGMPQKIECNSKVAVALQIMDECFLPMVDHRSGVNLIRNIVYNFGSNFSRLNYGSFLTIILERGDEMASAASIRIHGNHLAEMPFIGTRYIYRRQGMCRRLLSAIESALHSLNVEKLVIPAISELRETWTGVFGFGPLERSSSRIVRNMNMVVFPGVDMLQKPVPIHHNAGDDVAPVQGLKLNDSDDSRCPAGFDLNSTYEPNEQIDGNFTGFEHGAVESHSLGLNDTSDITCGVSDLPQNPSHQRSLDQIGEDPDYVEKNTVNMVHRPSFSLDDAGEQNGEVSGPAGTDDESKPLISHVGSEAAECGGGPILPTTAAASESNREETIVDLNLSLHEDSKHISAQSMDYEGCGLVSAAELSNGKAIHQGSETGVLSDGSQPRSPMADNGISLAAQTETLQVMGADGDVDNGRLTQCSLEPMCSSSSVPGVGLHLPLVGAVRAMPQS